MSKSPMVKKSQVKTKYVGSPETSKLQSKSAKTKFESKFRKENPTYAKLLAAKRPWKDNGR